jgi:hypothetical protein
VWSSVRELDVATGKVLRSIQPASEPLGSTMVVSPDGRWLAIGGHNEPFRVFDAATGKQSFSGIEPTTSPSGRADLVQGLTFAPDSSLMAECSGEEELLRFWDIRRKTCARTIRFKPGRPVHAVFSPDGSVLAVADSRGKVRLLETQTGKEVYSLPAFPGSVDSVAFSADGRFLVADGGAIWREVTLVRGWDLASGRQVAQWKGSCPTVSPDGRWLASIEEQGTILIWDARQVFCTPPAPHSEEDVARLYGELLRPNRARSYKAAWRLAGCPEQAVPLLRTRLRALRWPEADRVAALVARLGSDEFQEREDAEEALGRMGAVAVQFLRQALADKPSLEVYRRIERVLAKSENLEPPAKRRQAERALMALELMATPAARAVLEEVAHPSSRSGLRPEARAALLRLERRAAPIRKP